MILRLLNRLCKSNNFQYDIRLNFKDNKENYNLILIKGGFYPPENIGIFKTKEEAEEAKEKHITFIKG